MKNAIGIMVSEKVGRPPFSDRSTHARFCRIGKQMGLLVYVFSPLWMVANSDKIRGYTLSSSKTWHSDLFSLPDIIYNRCFFSDAAAASSHRKALQQMLARKSIRFLGASLKDKWTVWEGLHSEASLRPYLPITIRLKRLTTLLPWLEANGRQAFLKPEAGTHGKGTIHIRQHNHGMITITGRDFTNRSIYYSFAHSAVFLRWLQSFIKKKRYLLQPYLELINKDGSAYDIRSLVQKDGRGTWKVTGLAARIGQPGSMTSNLHGGGHAEDAHTFFQREFPGEQVDIWIERLQAISLLTASVLEDRFGRLAELGIDYGIDRQGQLWIIEVNSRPGRAAFDDAKDVYQQCVKRPLDYARYMLKQEGHFPLAHTWEQELQTTNGIETRG